MIFKVEFTVSKRNHGKLPRVAAPHAAEENPTTRIAKNLLVFHKNTLMRRRKGLLITNSAPDEASLYDVPQRARQRHVLETPVEFKSMKDYHNSFGKVSILNLTAKIVTGETYLHEQETSRCVSLTVCETSIIKTTS